MKQLLRYFSALLISCVLIQQTRADHSRVEYPFDDGNTVGWTSSMITSGSPFGGDYLGLFPGSSSVQLVILDALPTFRGGSASRPVNLSFDVVNFDPLVEVFHINGFAGDNPIFFNLDIGDVTGGSAPHYSFHVSFFLEESSGGDPTDILIDFNKVSTGDWGIDNVIVDWTIPEPSSVCYAALIGVLCAARIRRR